jgi:iturin family lipopeptide synthetase A
MKTIAKYVYNQVAANQLAHNEAKIMLKELQDLAANNEGEIAVIGMACRFPKASTPDEFWCNLVQGKNCIDDFPAERSKECRELSDKSPIARMFSGNPEEHQADGTGIYAKGGYLKEIDKFDAAFFKISPKEAMFIDPLQRMFLETAYEAMEDAGYGGSKLYGAKVGVFVGKDHTNSTMYKYVTEPDEMQLTGSWTGILASRISYIYNFHGPGMVIDTACSSGLVALHEACRALNKSECEMAIVGGIHVQIFPDVKGHSVMEMVESGDEHVRTFDKDASGTIWGEGVGALIVKPLEKALADHDYIYAIIKGSAINNDGTSSGITAPNAEAQKELIIRAWKEAKIDPETISYIEAHGTGTNLGDPIEIKGITSAFEEFTTKKQFCGIGSVKTNVGHLVAASGLASVIKVILALKNKEIPPTINFNSPNPYINFLNSPVYVNDRTQPWKSPAGSPRRAGVSAFGFSGTNCHVILEEPPAAPKTEIFPAQNLLEILTLSARNKNVLQELVKRYHDFLGHASETDLANICYTANTGRGHYHCRIALTVASLADLQQKIARLYDTDPEIIQEPGIYYNNYKATPDSQKGRTASQLTENERRQLTDIAGRKLQECITAGDRSLSPESAAELCRLYTQGADIAWAELYQDRNLTKMSLPVYPLERVKCWAPPNTAEIEGVKIDPKPIHPLLQKLLADTFEQKIYVTKFSIDHQWVLSEHRVQNYYIAPGTTYLEMARAASEAYYNDGPIELRDFLFIHPLAVEPGEPKEVHTIVKKEPEYLDFTVASKLVNSLGDEQWMVHAQGKIYQGKSGEAGRCDLAELKAKLDVERNRINVGESIGNENFTFGPRWNNIIFGVGENDQALLQFQLPEEFQDDLREYGIHPALMDQAADAFSQNIEGMRLPLMYKRMTIHDRMPANFYCHVRRKDPGNGNLETILLDATLFDESGHVFIEIEDYSLKRVRDGELKFTQPGGETFYYGFAWLPAELKAVDASVTEDSAILVFKDESGIAGPIIQELQARGRELIEVETGSGYEQITEHQYRIHGDEADYQQLMETLQGKKISQILHFMSIGKELGPETDLGSGLVDLEQQQFKGLFSLFYLTRVLSGFNYQHPIDLVLIADNVNAVTREEDRINPVAGAFFGLGKTVFSENEQLKCRAIDIDRYTAPDKIIAELVTPGPIYQVAYRHNQRFIEEFQTVELQNEPGNHGIKEGGVYIITGGTGGVGLEIGKYLARKVKAKLALISRTPMPGRESWNEVFARSEDRALCAKIAAILEMEQAGSEVLVFGADICSASSLQPALDELRRKFGRINGVIHAAGVAGAGFMIKKEIQAFKNVINPKIRGTWLLDKLTAADDLDFFIMFSSITTITGAAGQGDYTAANAYLDSFAAYRNKQGKRTISINWPLWEGTGMAAAYGVTDTHLIFKAVSPAKALEVFEEILGAGASRVIFGALNYAMISAVHDDLPFQLSERIEGAIKKQKARLGKGKEVIKENSFPKATVIGIDGQDEGQTPYILAQIWARVLGLTEIDANQNFYDQGGDSILASQLFKEIDREYPEVISISDIYSYSTVNELARLIDQKGGSVQRTGSIAIPGTEETKLMEAAKTETLEIPGSKLAETGEPGVAQVPAAASAEAPERTDTLPERNEAETLIAGKSRDNAEEIPEAHKFPAIYRVSDRWSTVQLFQRDEPDAKELTIKLQREITIALHRCLPLQVVLTDERLYPWFYEHYVNIFSQIESDGHLKLDFLEEWGVYRSVIGEISLGAHYLARQPDIIAFIIDNINQGKYLNVCADEYYMPRKMRTQKTHFIHHAFIYGYDNGKRELKTIGFNAENIIDQITFTYDEFRYAYERGKEYYRESAPWTSQTAAQLFFSNDFYGAYPFNLKIFLNKIYNYLHSVREDEIIYVWKLQKDNVKYGFQVYDIVLEYFEKILQGDTKIDYRVTHLLYEQKNMIAKRLAYIIGRYNLSGRMVQLSDAYLDIVEHFKTIRLKYYDLENRFSYRRPEPGELENAKTIIEQIIRMIREGREKERTILTEIYEVLNSMSFTD